ncbi:hypothetical protein POVWA2_007360 [Plasmodium ovale wallikeri]|uniref:Uncharacterized protein n=1 Tax=Plasmodium ovale wallikeri TaxID=864142 RepID=A0A1A8YIU5_PLAOA|nr:hypothetical protein POVWA1_007220 [Plasmodium ovale wallikeri]SBT32034.1 hypothetical protein POVWA2_007360 [Plasmodium ovale wallikeri]
MVGSVEIVVHERVSTYESTEYAMGSPIGKSAVHVQNKKAGENHLFHFFKMSEVDDYNYNLCQNVKIYGSPSLCSFIRNAKCVSSKHVRNAL